MDGKLMLDGTILDEKLSSFSRDFQRVYRPWIHIRCRNFCLWLVSSLQLCLYNYSCLRASHALGYSSKARVITSCFFKVPSLLIFNLAWRPGLTSYRENCPLTNLILTEVNTGNTNMANSIITWQQQVIYENRVYLWLSTKFSYAP